MPGFIEDRALIMSLTDAEAHELLAFLDAEERKKPLPSSLEAALIAAVRCPDISRYFLVQKSDRYARGGDAVRHAGPSCAVISLRRAALENSATEAAPAKKPAGSGHIHRL